MKRFAFIVLSCLCAAGAYSQEVIDFSKVKAPSSPAFTILGVQPNDISRPKSYKDLEASLLSSFTDGNTVVLPDNFALEFSPYWMQSNPVLTYEEAANPTPWQSARQNFSVSVANGTAPSLKDSSATNVRMGIGIRTRIDFQKASEEVREYFLAQTLHALYEDSLDEEQTWLIGLRSEVSTLKRQAAASAVPLTNTTSAEALRAHLRAAALEGVSGMDAQTLARMQANVERFIDLALAETDFSKQKDEEILAEILQRIDLYTEGETYMEFARRLEEQNTEVLGFFTEVATGLVLDFPTNDIGFSNLPKYGIWLTPGYKWENIELMAFYRLMWDNYTGLSTVNHDIGARLVYSWNKLSISGEFIQRFQESTLSRVVVDDITYVSSKTIEDHKMNLNLEYRFNSKVILNYSIGQGFSFNNLSGTSGLNVVAGFNYAFGGLTSESIRE